MRKAFLVKFVLHHGMCPLLGVSLSQETSEWLGCYDGPINGKALIMVNDRHLVCVRECPESGRFMLLDTVAEELPENGINLQRFLNRTQVLAPQGEEKMTILDKNTPQQPKLLGGCCVMSLRNFTLPHGVYSSVENGEKLRLEYGTEIVKDVMRGRTPLDMVVLFDELFYSRKPSGRLGSLCRFVHSETLY